MGYDSNDRDDGTFERCPFCGSKMKLNTIHDPYVDIQVIGHAENMGQICPMTRGMSMFGTEEEAAAVWNKRRWKVKHTNIVRDLVMILVIVLVVICIVLTQPVHAAGQRIVDWPELPKEPDPAEVTALAQTLYGECRGCSELQQRAVCWCIFNRVDDSRFPDTVVGVITQKSQFFGYSASNPVWDSLFAVAHDCLVDWHNGENRVLEPEFLYFTGNGRINIFTTEYGGGERWAEE